MDKKRFDLLLTNKIFDGVTEYYFSPGTVPFYRIDGNLMAEDMDVVSTEMTEQLMDMLLIDREKIRFMQDGDIEIPYAISGVGRFRLHFGRQRSSVTITIHMKNSEIPGVKQLQLPDAIVDLTECVSGLLLITGTKKSGKSTTAASLVQYISERTPRLIATIERPIRYLFSHGKGIVNQREVGIDIDTMTAGLQDAVDDYADVIYVSDLSERGVTEKVLDALERGYFVIACTHGDSVASVLTRMQHVLGPEKQAQTKLLLANHLRGVVCQKLLRGNEGGLEPVFEVLIANQSVRNMLEQNKIGQLESIFESQRQVGTVSMSAALIDAVEEGRISAQTAINATAAPKELRKRLIRVGD